MIKNILNEKNFKVVLRVFLGLIFIVSGISKLIGPENFIKEIDKLNFISPALTKPSAYFFILGEFILGLLLWFKMNKKVLGITMVLMVVFCCYLGYKVFINDSCDCGCFGNFIHRSNSSALIQNLFILIAVIYEYE